jgi:hypothetical protein
VLTTSVKPLLVYGPPPALLSVIFSVNPYDPAGVEFEVVTVKVIFAPLVPLGVNVGVVPVPPEIVSVVDVKLHVTPVGVPLVQVRRILSALGADEPDSDNVIVYVTDVPVPDVAVPV